MSAHLVKGTLDIFRHEIFLVVVTITTKAEPPDDIGIVIEGVEVLNQLTSVASACALLLGLIYALNLAYPKPLRFTFEALQKIIMQLEQHKMSPKFLFQPKQLKIVILSILEN
uniref:Uncharacterized protein n=1 Tax=Scophthalmus maximus TaxID=52904 RepID=A0A8D3B9M8_SCOMX